MFDDDGEQNPAEKRAEELAPKTRDLAAEITPEVAQEDDGEDLLEGGLLERHDEVEAVNVDGETATTFWAAVVYVNVGLLLVSIGPMLAFFRGRTQVGALLVVLGGFALYRAYTVYRSYTTSSDESEVADGDEANGEDEPDDKPEANDEPEEAASDETPPEDA